MVTEEREDLVVGMLMHLIVSPQLGSHPQSPGLRHLTHLNKKWEQQVINTVTLLHTHGIVWGDVNPYNVAIDEDMNAWVIDFGGRNTPEFVDGDKAETKEGDWQGVQRFFGEWLPAGRGG